MNRYPFFLSLSLLVLSGCEPSGPIVEFSTLDEVYAYTEQQANDHGDHVRIVSADKENGDRLRATDMAERFCDCASNIDLDFVTNNETYGMRLSNAQQALGQENITPEQEKILAYYATLVLCSEMIEYRRIKGTFTKKMWNNTLRMAQHEPYSDALDSLCPQSKQLMESYIELRDKRKKEDFERGMEALKKMQGN